MTNKYCCANTRAEKLRILAKNTRYHFNVEGTPLTIYNFADYQELLNSTCGVDVTQAIYELLCTETA